MLTEKFAKQLRDEICVFDCDTIYAITLLLRKHDRFQLRTDDFEINEKFLSKKRIDEICSTKIMCLLLSYLNEVDKLVHHEAYMDRVDELFKYATRKIDEVDWKRYCIDVAWAYSLCDTEERRKLFEKFVYFSVKHLCPCSLCYWGYFLEKEEKEAREIYKSCFLPHRKFEDIPFDPKSPCFQKFAGAVWHLYSFPVKKEVAKKQIQKLLRRLSNKDFMRVFEDSSLYIDEHASQYGISVLRQEVKRRFGA